MRKEVRHESFLNELNSVACNSKMTTNVDDVLIKFNIFGRYYVTLLILLFLAALSNIMNCNNYIFTAMEVDYRCVDGRFGKDSCPNLSNSTDVCAEWVYDEPHSFVAEFQLACQEWKRTLLGTVNSLGYMFGLFIFGLVSDRIGRKKTLIMNGIFGALIGTTKSFLTCYWSYLMLEFMETLIGSVSSPAFILTMEMVSHDKRIFYSTIVQFGCGLAFLILPLVAWSAQYWRHTLRIVYLPGLIYILYIFLLDESPRWLLSQGRKDEAVAILQKTAKICKVKLDTKDLDNLSHEEVKGVKFTQLLKDTFLSRTLLKRVFICITWWIASTFVNYGMQINSVSLQGNKYVNFAYLCIPKILGVIVSAYLILRYKRKMPLACCFFLAALLCTCQAFIPKGLPWLSIILYMSGKFMSEIFFAITYIYTSELFPTYTRNSMHALCSSVGRIGSMVAPQTPLLMVYWRGLPLMLCGIVSLVAGLVTLLATNTTDDSLPDTVLQAEAIGHKESVRNINKSSIFIRHRETEPENHENRF